MWIRIRNLTFRRDILEGLSKSEAVKMFANVPKATVEEAWMIANPTGRKTKKKK